MSTSFRFISSPGDDFHFSSLGIDPTANFILHSNDELIDIIEQPFEKGSVATVFHVHEVMRIVLSQLNAIGNEEDMMVHSNKISSRFERLSYHAASIWSDWGAAVEAAGGAIRTILQRMFGVRIRQNGWWIPHLNPKYIEVDSDWSIIDDVVTTTEILQSVSSNSLWLSKDTGIRLICGTVKQQDCSETLDHFFGKGHRFASASAWLKWCLENGTRQELPSDQGTPFYFKGIINNEVPRYFPNHVRNNGPYESEWWSLDVHASDVPKFNINGENWALGMIWRRDEEHGYWLSTYPHFYPIGEGYPINISAPGMGLSIVTDVEEIEDNDLGPIDVRQSLSNHLVTEHLRAVRCILIELGYALPPNEEERIIGGLGLSGSRVPSPFSDLYFLNTNNSSNIGVVIGSPIETIIRREILKINWYVIE